MSAFRGDRSLAYSMLFGGKLDAEKAGTGPGPTRVDTLLYAGHTGVSTDAGRTVYGFNPDGGGKPTWQVLDDLKAGLAFPGVVSDDTGVFAAARAHGLTVYTVRVILPDPVFVAFEAAVLAQRSACPYRYGFPNGHGDCNCTTWLERMGLPLLTGRMDEFTSLPRVVAPTPRRFGECV